MTETQNGPDTFDRVIGALHGLPDITLSLERTNDWKVKCDSCKQLRRCPIRLLIIGNTGIELCPECVDELKAAVAA